MQLGGALLTPVHFSRHISVVGLERSRPAYQGISPKHCIFSPRAGLKGLVKCSFPKKS